MQKRFRYGIVGGTFDLLHSGHKKLLAKTFELAETVTIGLSLPELYANKPLAAQIQNYTTREHALREYLKIQSWDTRSSIIPLENFYGTTLTDEHLEAIFVTEETNNNAQIINNKRKEKNLPLLTIVIADYALGDDGQIVSSKRIREGLINREGESYEQLFKQTALRILPDHLRATLQKPHGKVITASSLTKDSLVITVGDVVSVSLRDENIFPAISIIDGKTRRTKIDKTVIDKYFSNLTPAFANEHGTINSSVAPYFLQALQRHKVSQKPQVILVTGEEDLLALPAILLSPLESVVVYGQHEVGMVAVTVTEEKKEEIRLLLTQF